MAGFLCLDELFEGRHFDREVIVLCVRWYLRFKLSYRDLAEMMAERACNAVGFITPPMRLPRRRLQGGSRDSDDERRPRAYRSAPLFARRGRAALLPCSSASAASCSCVWQ